MGSTPDSSRTTLATVPKRAAYVEDARARRRQIERGAARKVRLLDQQVLGTERQDVEEAVAVALRHRGVHQDRVAERVRTGEQQLETEELLEAARAGVRVGARASRIDDQVAAERRPVVEDDLVCVDVRRAATEVDLRCAAARKRVEHHRRRSAPR